MHAEALDAVRKMMFESGYAHGEVKHVSSGLGSARYGLDLGGADVNGTARDLFASDVVWRGLDIEEGPGVDYVADARNWRDADVWFDVVLCTELLEHVEHWQAVPLTIWEALAPGGFAFLTCASIGRGAHGARGGPTPMDGEYYANVPLSSFSAANQGIPWREFHVTYNPAPGDLYAWMQR